MRSLQDRMNDMKPYFRGVEMYNEALIVRVILPQKWKVYNSADERIKVTPSESVANEYFYYANSSDSSYDEMFDLIEETIKVNNEMTLKLSLLQEKVNELRELFSTTSYDDLKRMRFTIEEVKETKPKRKYTKRKKAAENENNDVVEATAVEYTVSDNADGA